MTLTRNRDVSMHSHKRRWLVQLVLWCACAVCTYPCNGQTSRSAEDLLAVPEAAGRSGGRLVASLRADPKTLNPGTALDVPSKEVISLLFADLIHINLYTQKTESALARSWKVSADGMHYTIDLRRGLRFSNGEAFDADDVIFSLRVYLDEKVHSPQRDLLKVDDKPISIRKTGPYQVVLDLPHPYAAAERLLDSVYIFPRRLLEEAYSSGKISQSWTPTTAPGQIAGLGPYRLKEYVPAEKIVLEKNPYYWKEDGRKQRLPYLDQIVFLIVPTQDAEVIRFQAGDLDIIDNVSTENFDLLARDQNSRDYHVNDLGPGFEYDFLFFNLNDLSAKPLPDIRRKQEWFQREEFRQAISAAIDRDAIARLVYRGRATPLWGQVTPGNKNWINSSVPHPPRSQEKALDLLRAAGFSRRADGALLDPHGSPVEFSIMTSPSNAQRTKMATVIQADLSSIGVGVHLVPLEFQAVMSKVFESFDYEAAILGLVSGDADPNPEINVWTSGGATHIWAPSESVARSAWQAELDQLMHEQTTIMAPKKRKQAYDHAQMIIAEHVPVIFLVSPDVLVGVRNSIGGIKPSVLHHHLLWNAEQLFRVPPANR